MSILKILTDSYFVNNNVVLYITEKSDLFETFSTTKSKVLLVRNTDISYSVNHIDFDDISEIFPVCHISDEVKSFTIINNVINIVLTEDRVMVPLDDAAIDLIFKYQL
ncbi:hypothetical protein FDI40_gp504 [Agrobacterium phage Atu_ph07]|uniref:Uncharacterized protein n=1 Tax=Agrobacterium phage Atu_ph07 TaxID=2024264 RepID=A0A2L0V0F6_9CAUD|nr:hypothetical protein FDI40_gp504 [Agrobacterium phage Atu_ph07]AUZ95263.1 hypothetical protein [Agrobacterium phage Atu_ph07]